MTKPIMGRGVAQFSFWNRKAMESFCIGLVLEGTEFTLIKVDGLEYRVTIHGEKV